MPLGSCLRGGLAKPLLPLNTDVAFNPGGPVLLGHPTVSQDLLSQRSATVFSFDGEEAWVGTVAPFKLPLLVVGHCHSPILQSPREEGMSGAGQP